ncbi:MAG TPA: hypothetical protein VJ276_18075 [Thermoanaerobaculia bacterium]|nr:hypothetical protein [Thermoanaerobaculia bacterium]
MSANPTTLNATSKGSPAHEERSRQALIKGAKAINAKGHDVLDAEGKVVSATAVVKDYEEKNADLLKVHSSLVMKYIVFLFGLVCVYCLDVLLFGATAEYVASLISGNWIIVLLAKYGVPLFFLGVEVLCSVKMIEAREAHEMQKQNEEVPSYGW